MIAITLVGAAIAVGFISGQFGTSTLQLGASVDANINYLRERTVIAYANFPNGNGGVPPLNTTAVLLLYNNGLVSYTISSISITGLIDTTGTGGPGTLETVFYYGIVGGKANNTISVVNGQTGKVTCNVPASTTSSPPTVAPSLLSATGASPVPRGSYSALYTLNLPDSTGACGSQLYLSGNAYTIVITASFGSQATVVRVK